MKLHPVTLILISIIIFLPPFFLPIVKSLTLLSLWVFIIFCLPPRSGIKPFPYFYKTILPASFFLFLINAVSLFPPGISKSGINDALRGIIRISSVILPILFLSKELRSEELLAFLIRLKVPPYITAPVFRIIWLIPRFKEKASDCFTVMQLRGIKMDTLFEKFRALILSLGIIFSSLFEEIAHNSAVLFSKGFFGNLPKTSIIINAFSKMDFIVLIISIIMVSAVICY